ncbi:MAG: glycosyltransferase family 4 protein [Bacilli bacterium]|jgi:glycosyltransferase involved in cell wall biosynthesis|nr:glycosyltransferase family 4 protein [Bacilli bacterium]
MKIALVNKFFYYRGGSETYYFNLASALKKEGVEVSYFAMNSPQDLKTEDNKYFVSHKDYNGATSIFQKLKMTLSLNYSKETYRNMMRFLTDKKPDFVLLNLINKQITFSVVNAIEDFNKKYSANIKTLYFCHDMSPVCPDYLCLNNQCEICEECFNHNFKQCLKKSCIDGSRLKSFLGYYEAEYIYKHKYYERIDGLLVASEFQKQLLLKSNDIKNRIFVVNHMLPPDFVYLCNIKNSDYYLYLGRIAKEKGLSTLCEAFKLNKLSLKIVGDGDILASLIQKYHSCTNIEFVGSIHHDQIEDFIDGAKAVIIPSEWYEVGPYSAYEALGRGKPLIVSDSGALPFRIKDNGFVFKTKNVESLNQAVSKIEEMSESEYIDLCEKAYKSSFEYDASKNAKILIYLFKSL